MICRPQSGADEKSPGGDVSTPIEVPDRCTGPTGSRNLAFGVAPLLALGRTPRHPATSFPHCEGTGQIGKPLESNDPVLKHVVGTLTGG